MSAKTVALDANTSPPSLPNVLAHLRHGNLPQATIEACAALDRGDTHALFFHLRASRLEQAGNLKAALADLSRAHELAPEDPAIGNALGLALTRTGRYPEAIKTFDAAVKSAPGFAAAHFNKGLACEAAGYPEAARTSYLAAIALEPKIAEPFARLASLSARQGDYQTAMHFGQEATARNPDHPLAQQALVAADTGLGRLTDADARLQRILASETLPEHDRYLAMGLLGELRERQNRFDEAFEAFARGNEAYYLASRSYFPPGRTALASIEWLSRYYSTVPVRRSAPADDRGEATTHVFLLGFPRSGTTLLEQALASHPAVSTMEEKDAFEESMRAFMGGPEDHSRLATLGAGALKDYRDAYWQRVADFGFAPAGKVFVDKLPFHTMKLPLISALFPAAKILFAIRDPRDVVLGCFRARFRVNPYMIELLRLPDAARFYAAYMKLADLYRIALPLATCDVRHEDLVTDFDSTSRSVCGFLGIEWTASMRDFASPERIRKVATPTARQLAGGLNRSGLGRWRVYEQQLAPIMPILAPWVERFGYAGTAI